MPQPQPYSVKQCDSDPNLHWLRALLNPLPGVAFTPPDADQVSWCRDEGLAPLLASKLGAACAAFQSDARQLAMRELAHEEALQRLAIVCRKAAIEIMVIKGEALARTLYAAPGQRLRSDIDLWVRQQQLEPLCSLLSKLGYAAISNVRQQWARFEVVHAKAQAPSVAFDVHVHPFFRPRMLQQRPFEAVWADAGELPGLAPLRAPNAADAFLIAALHLAKNSHKRAIWLYDIERFCVVAPEAVTRCCTLAPAWGIAQLVADALTRTIAAFGTKPPCKLPQPLGREVLSSMLRQPGKLSALHRDLSMLPHGRARLHFLLELFARP